MTSDAFSTLIGDIYECVLEAGRWPGVLGRVCAEIGGPAGWIAVHFPDRVTSSYQIECGTDPEWQRRLRERYVGSSPFIGLTHYVRPGDILSVGDVIDYDEFTRGRFYREWASPQGWPDLVFAVLAREPDRFSFLGVCLPCRATAEHKRMAGLYHPHLDRALRIADVLDVKDAEIADLSHAAEAMVTGIVLIDERWGVRGVNAAAKRMLAARRDLALSEGQLRLASHGAEPLRTALANDAPGTGATVLLASEEGADLKVQLTRLPRGRTAHRGCAVAALFLSEPARTEAGSPEPFATRFGLTPSEVRVALALLEGGSPRRIAEAQGVTLATVRTHLRRLYDKTGTSGQAALVKLVSATIRGV